MEKEVCEYHDCIEEGTVYDESLKVWLCEKHSNMVENRTGYCSWECQLGYGCDGSC